jgi:chemotaxis protein CheD
VTRPRMPAARPPDRPIGYVQPGQLVVSAVPRTLSTILGSCVAVCLWDPVVAAGGMNPYLLPSGPRAAAASPRFGEVAVPDLVHRLVGLGGWRNRMEAKVFGGARVLLIGDDGLDHLGSRNVDLAVELLRQEGIAIVGGDVGGRQGRRVLFDTASGQAWVRPL